MKTFGQAAQWTSFCEWRNKMNRKTYVFNQVVNATSWTTYYSQRTTDQVTFAHLPSGSQKPKKSYVTPSIRIRPPFSPGKYNFLMINFPDTISLNNILVLCSRGFRHSLSNRGQSRRIAVEKFVHLMTTTRAHTKDLSTRDFLSGSSTRGKRPQLANFHVPVCQYNVSTHTTRNFWF